MEIGMKIETFIKLIKEEVEWCNGNKGVSGKTSEFENGFIHGLKHSITVIDRYKKIEKWIN